MSDASAAAVALAGGLELPGDERETLEGCLRQIDFLDAEIASRPRDRRARARLARERRLMTVPGVSLHDGDDVMPRVGDIAASGRRASWSAISALTPGPPVGIRPARHGRISKQGAAEARQMLAEAAWVAVRTAGPMRAFYERVRARRGQQIAIVAVARKLAVLFWHLLTREQDYAFGRPVADPQEAAPARAARRRRAPARTTRPPHQGKATARRRTRPRARALRTCRSRLPPPRHRLAALRRRARARHRDAHLQKPSNGKQRGKA